MTTVLSKKTYYIIQEWLQDQVNAFARKSNDYAQLLNDLDREGATELKVRNAQAHLEQYEYYTDAACSILLKFKQDFEVKRNDQRV